MMLRDSFIWRLLLFFVAVTKKNVSYAEITYGQNSDSGHTVIWKYVYDAVGNWDDRCGTGLAISGDANFYVYGCPEYWNDSGRGDVHLKSRSGSTRYDYRSEFRGRNNNEHAGQHLTMSYDGRFFAIGIPITDESSRFSEGRVIVHESASNNIWNNRNQADEYTIYPSRTVGDNTLFGDNVKFNSDGTVIAVSNSRDTLVALQNVGSVTVYMLNGNTYRVMGAPIVGSTENGRFGLDIALSSNGMTLCVGEPGANRVRVYQYDSDILLPESWTQVGNSIEMPTTTIVRKLQDDTSDAQFGYSVDISADGSQIIVGAPGVSDEKGEVYVYTYNTSNGTWVQRGSNFEGSISNARMGQVVCMADDGEKIAISSPNYPLESGVSGIAHVFFFSTDLTGDWVQWGNTLNNPFNIPNLFERMEFSGDGTVLSSSSPDNYGYILQWFAFQYVSFCFWFILRTNSLKNFDSFNLVTSTYGVTNA